MPLSSAAATNIFGPSKCFARAVIGLNNLKIISFGPRPLNFLACNAPIQQLYNIGVEIEENSELDLFEAFNKHAGDERIPAIVKEMEEELGAGNKKPEILSKLAQYELTLKDWVEEHRGYRNSLCCQTAVDIAWYKSELCLECRPAALQYRSRD